MLLKNNYLELLMSTALTDQVVEHPDLYTVTRTDIKTAKTLVLGKELMDPVTIMAVKVIL